MRSLTTIVHWEVQYVYTHMRVAYILFRSSHRHQMAQVVIRAEVAPVWWRCTLVFAPEACLWIFRSAILPKKAAVRLIFANHCRVSFDRSLHLVLRGKINTLLLLFSDFGARFLYQFLCFLYCVE
jgi:hypothetical protein